MPDPSGGRVTILPKPSSPSAGFGFYGPGAPIPPIVEGSAIRQWDFQPGTNSTQTPRHTEPFSFAHLRAFANVELVRLAIETRKDQLENQDFIVRPRDTKLARAKERDSRCLEIEKFLAKPDGVTHFGAFFRALDEDLLVLDAPCFECRRTRGGKLLGIEYVDGATINLLIDETGRRPRGPEDIAFQQIIRGVVWANLANRDLIYAPRNVRSNHIYGFGPVEQLIVTISTIIKRQASQLSYFTEGNVPAGYMTAPDGWTNEQIRDLQEWWDQRISGNQGEQRKLVWGPHDSKYQAFKDAPLKDDFDEWLARKVAFAFSLPPTPFVRQMNKGTANEDQDRALEEGLEPLKLWRKRLIDNLIAEEFGYPDLEFSFREDVDIDPGKQAEIDDRRLRNGSAIIDEVRERAGDDPLPNGLGARAMIYGADGAVPLEAIDAIIERKTAPPPTPQIAAQPGAPAPGGKKPKPAEAGPRPGKQQAGPKPANKLSKASEIPSAALALSIDRPSAAKARMALAKKIRPILAKAGKAAAADIKAELGKADRDPQDLAASLAQALDLRALLGLEDELEPALEEIGQEAGSLALASIGVEAESDLVDQVNERAVAYAKERAAQLVSDDGDESLIESTREMIRGIIAGGLEDNIGRDAIAELIESATAFSEYRADLIADTEIAFANSAAKGEAWAEVAADGALMVKQWFVSGEDGVCDECEGNEDQGEIDFDQEFESGDAMEPAHPGCRCVTTARVLEADDNADAEG